MKTKDKIISTLLSVENSIKSLQDELYIIGAAALILSDVNIKLTSDIDIMTSNDDAERLKVMWKNNKVTQNEAQDHSLFYSNFSRYTFDHLDIEIMGSLQVQKEGMWTPLVIHDFLKIPIGRLIYKIPTLQEQIRILTWFGRDKDLEKLEILRIHKLHEI